MEITNIKIEELKPFAKNPKKHPEAQLNMLKKSMQEFGWTSPILVADDNMVVAGHARLQAATELNFTEVPVIKLDLPYEKAVAYVIADNRLAELAETDGELLAGLLTELSENGGVSDMEALGFTFGEIDDILSTDIEDIVLDDFILDDVELAPCWFVIRANENDFDEIKDHLGNMNISSKVVSNSHDG